MSKRPPIGERAVGAALGLLAAAFLLVLGVQLIESILRPLLAIALVTLTAGGVVVLGRRYYRRDRW